MIIVEMQKELKVVKDLLFHFIVLLLVNEIRMNIVRVGVNL